MVKIFLRNIRIEKNLSATKLADLSGISKTHILNIERGEASPTLNCLCKLSCVLKVEVYELFQCVCAKE